MQILHKASLHVTRSLRRLIALIIILYAPALHAAQPTLMIFWRPDCPPCMHELELLPAWSAQYPSLHITLISLADEHSTQAVMAKQSLPDTISIQLAQDSNEATLGKWGDARYILPYSVFLAHNGAPCGTHIGLLGSDQIDSWIKQCKN